jgi:hypothetical protein
MALNIKENTAKGTATHSARPTGYSSPYETQTHTRSPTTSQEDHDDEVIVKTMKKMNTFKVVDLDSPTMPTS